MKKLSAISFGVVIGLLSVALVPAQEIPKEIKGGILNGKATFLPPPEYPSAARAAQLEGTVLVDVVIDEGGKVASAVAATDVRKTRWVRGKESGETEIQPADPMLREAAEKAALEARFSPTRLSQVPVKVSGSIIYKFVLSDSEISGGLLNGKAISLPMPAYPDAALPLRACGTVSVKVTFDENGDVISAVATSGHPLLKDAAVKAAKEAKFSPTSLDGQFVKVSGVLNYKFVVPGGNGECSSS